MAISFYPLQNLSDLVTVLLCVFWIAFFSGCDSASTPIAGEQLYALKNPTRSWQVPEKKTSDAVARLTIDSRVIDLGVVDPTSPVLHDWQVRNMGNLPLTLKRTDDEPSLTVLSELPTTVQPGAAYQLQLQWLPAASVHSTSFAAATLLTNDPAARNVELKVSGKVRSQFLVDPPVLFAKRPRPDRTTEMQVVVCSQRWEQFELSEVTSDLSGLTWDLEPAEEKVLQKLNAQSGWLLTAHLPAGLPSGKVSDKSLTLQVLPTASGQERQTLKIPIEANVLRRLAVYGGGIDKTGTIFMGVQPRGVAHRRKLVLKVLDEQKQLDLQKATSQPDFLNLELSPYEGGDGVGNLYQLEVEIPADAPEYVARGTQLGQIHLEFDHPRITELKLKRLIS